MFSHRCGRVDSLCLVVVWVGLDVLFVAVLAVEAGVTLATVEHAHSVVDIYVDLHGWEEKKAALVIKFDHSIYACTHVHVNVHYFARGT